MLKIKQQISQAVAQYQLVVKATPNNVVALNNLAALLMEQKDASAYGYAQRAFAIHPSNPVVMDTYGWGLLQQGKLQEATPLLKQAAQAMPDSPEVQFHWASALTKSGNNAEARALLQKILAKHKSFDGRDKAEDLLKSIDASGKS